MENSEKLWGGRFTGKPDETFKKFNDSFSFDRRLFAADIAASIAHAGGLKRAGVISAAEADTIIEALRTLAAASGDADLFDVDAEDVHSFIESRLVALIGDSGKRLHTGRSRNDQVATAFRLWMRDAIDLISERTKDVQRALVNAAERHFTGVLPGYTHLQRAQPILWPHWCLAYFEMLERDRARLSDVRKRVNVMPLGAAALAGTAFPIDREAVARELGFDDVARNSLDAVSDRDFTIEFCSAAALTMVHLSRLAEDLILYCSSEFAFITLSDAVSTGSSLMPQKKNPDALELLRGKTGRVAGTLTGLLMTMKGLPLAYNKDMQEDKEAVFDAADTLDISLQIAAIVLNETTLNESRSRSAAQSGYLNATELADHLVKKGMPFRTAHDAAGKLVLLGIEKGKELNELSLDEMRQIVADIDESVFDALGLEQTLAARSATGGTAPSSVRQQLDRAKEHLK